MIFVFEYYIFFFIYCTNYYIVSSLPNNQQQQCNTHKVLERTVTRVFLALELFGPVKMSFSHTRWRKTRLKSWKLRTTTRGESIDTLSKLKYVCSRNYFQLKQIGLSRVNNRLRINEAVCYLFTVHVDRLCLRARALVSLPLRSVTIMSYQ